MHRSILSMALLAGVPAAAILVGCSTAPRSVAGQQDLQRESDRRLQQAVSLDPSLRPVLDNSAGYAVFPVVGEGGFVLGGGYGKGSLYERGQFTGFVDITSVSGGLKIGGQQYSQLIVFQTPGPLSAFKNGTFTLSADASAVALRSGIAANSQFRDNVQVFIWDQAGLMADASIGAQTFRFTPAGDAAQAAGGWYESESMDHRQTEYQGYREQDALPAGERIDGDVNIQRDRRYQQQDRPLQQNQQYQQNREIRQDGQIRSETEIRRQDGQVRSETEIRRDRDARPAGGGLTTSDVDIRDDYRTTPDGNLNRNNNRVTEERRTTTEIQRDRSRDGFDVDVDTNRRDVNVDIDAD